MNPTLVLRGFKILLGALGLVIAQLSRTLIRNELIPQQLDFIATLGVLFILVALIIAIIYQQRLPKILWIVLTVAVVCLAVLLFFQLRFVKTVTNLGNPPARYRFIIGYRVSDQGAVWRGRIGNNLTEEEYIRRIGPDRIAAMYGNSYYVNAGAYSVSYLVFMVAVVLALGGILALVGNRIVGDDDGDDGGDGG